MSLFRLVNYQEHPSNNTYMVFNFSHMEKADYFESLLVENEIVFEKHLDDEREDPVVYYGVKKNRFKEVSRLNFMASAKFRKPMIQNRYVGYAFLIFMISLITLAIISANR
jgi:hypothetical protein